MSEQDEQKLMLLEVRAARFKVMPLQETMDLITSIIGKGCTPEDRRMYEIELSAYREVLHGDPFNETRYCHANERYIYRETRAQAELQQKIHGNGGN